MKYICMLYSVAFHLSFGKNAIREMGGLLPYIKKAGFDGVYLIALWEDGGYDNGFDIVRYSVNPLFGSHEDFLLLIEEAHRLGLTVGVDIVPNHVSDRNFLAQRCLEGVSGYEDCLYVVTKSEAERLTEAGVPSFFGNLAYSPFGDKYVRSTFADYHQLNLNWGSKKVQEYFAEVFKGLKSIGVDFARIDCGMMLLEDVTKANRQNPMACMNPRASIEAIRRVSGGMPMFFEWFDPNTACLFEGMPECYALDCSYVMTGRQNLEWHHPKLIPLLGGHDQMTLADRGIDMKDAVAKMRGCSYGFLDMQTIIRWATDPKILPGDFLVDADLGNPNQRYRARRPIAPVMYRFMRSVKMGASLR